MRAADALVKLLVEKYQVNTVFTVTGGGAMYLNDAFGKDPRINYVALHHEQSVSMAAEGLARISNGLAVAQVTTGPGGTNAISGCVGAWIDSEPILFISGQVESFSIARHGTRQSGVQEVNIVEYVKPFTKYAVRIDDANDLLQTTICAIEIALEARCGPVWIDIPLNVQNQDIEYISEQRGTNKKLLDKRNNDITRRKVKSVLATLISKKRPVLCVGNGARKSISVVKKLSETLGIPIILGWNAKDTIEASFPNLIGCAGQFGDRASNLLLKDADYVIGLGYRFSVPQVGYNPSTYAPNAEIVSVDIDPGEASKCGFFINNFIECDVSEFLTNVNEIIDSNTLEVKTFAKWINWASYLKNFSFEPANRSPGVINSFDFTDVLSEKMPVDAAVVTDMGTSFTCTHQQIKLKKGQRLITSSGLAAMGFGLPGAIGVAIYNRDCQTILVTGDGGLMFNLQELQSVITHDLNLRIIIYENQGYLTMKHMQRARFDRIVAADPKSRVSCPDFTRVCSAFDLDVREIVSHSEITAAVDWLLAVGNHQRVLVVHLDPWQELTPRVQTRSDENGRLYPSTLDQMYPFLSKEIEIVLDENRRKILE